MYRNAVTNKVIESIKNLKPVKITFSGRRGRG